MNFNQYLIQFKLPVINSIDFTFICIRKILDKNIVGIFFILHNQFSIMI